MLVAFVPARGGSKGIPRKNLILLGGKPLIQYTVEAAMDSRLVDEIFLSTDDEEIATFCGTLGVKTSYRRPQGLAGDTASMLDAVKDGLAWMRMMTGHIADELILLQPTSPLRTTDDIDGAVVRFRSAGADTLFSVHAMIEHPCECIAEGGGQWRYLAEPPEKVVRRQDYPEQFYYINGAIYVARTRHLLAGGSFVEPGRSALYEMPPERGVDIDTPLNIRIAEALLSSQCGSL